MSSIQTILSSVLASAGVTAFLIWLTKTWISERLKNAIKNEYDLKLEEYKVQLELVYNDQVTRRQLYDEFSMFIEDTFGTGNLKSKEQLSLAINKLFAKLALYAPDDVYRVLKDALVDKPGVVYGKDVKPEIYCALRNSLFGDRTHLTKEDFVDHIAANHIPTQEEGTKK